MRSTITIDAHLLKSLQEETGGRSKTQAVLLAIDDFLRRRRVVKIKSLKGRLKFDKTAESLRHYVR